MSQRNGSPRRFCARIGSHAINRIVLGTVQFGLPYGIANGAGQVGRDEATAILAHASAMGIDTLDTASAYGESEQRLGEVGIAQWRVITKLPSVPEHCKDVSIWVRECVQRSLERLKTNQLHGLLLHHPLDLLTARGRKLYESLLALKADGEVEKIGVSVYGPDELESLWPCFQFDLVQAPLNVLDRRVAVSGWLARLNADGVEVHVRSVFLQGLLLMERDCRPAKFDCWEPLWNHWHRWLNEQALTPVKACLNFVLSQPAVDRVVIGVDSLKQLQEILAGVEVGSTRVPPESLMSDDLDLINPSRWNNP